MNIDEKYITEKIRHGKSMVLVSRWESFINCVLVEFNNNAHKSIETKGEPFFMHTMDIGVILSEKGWAIREEMIFPDCIRSTTNYSTNDIESLIVEFVTSSTELCEIKETTTLNDILLDYKLEEYEDAIYLLDNLIKEYAF
jgi:hypothetical protein